ncbi:ABC transporter permease [Streptomyces sp. NPDC020983]|uniref:ABC transporter permease n=1 Tax=Streptomyces sp. NPDC020983 TaxID=3365106 RepID=UPI00379B81AE
MSWLRWLVRRLLLAVLVVYGAATAGFLALRLTPGDPARTLLGLTVPDPQQLTLVRHDLGFDRPLVVQYGIYLGHLVRGDLGLSYQLQEPVSTVIGSQLWSTVQLALSALALALLFAALLAVSSAGRWPVLRGLFSAVELSLTAVPSFGVGVLLLTVFSFRLTVFPAAGGSGPSGLVLPAVTLALSLTGVFAQVLRHGLEEALEQPFTLTARARGTGETAVRLRHAVRHALIPLITLSGWTVGTLLGGAVVVETVFSRQGLGQVVAVAVEHRDFPVVTGVIVVTASVFALLSIVVDGLYRVVDPRLREVV